jgi:hypothetical protein
MRGDEPAIPRSAIRMECLSCRYSLVGLERGECPECGRGFDPGDARTFFLDTGIRPPLFHRGLARVAPPRWLHGVLVVGLAAALVWASSPNGALNDMAALVPMLIVFALLPAWAFMAGLHFVTRRVMQFKGEPLPARRWVWLVTPVILCSYLVLWRTGAVFWARWEHARHEFGLVQQQIAASGANTQASQFKVPARVGTFDVVRFDYLPDGTIQIHLGDSEQYTDTPARLEIGPSAPTGSPAEAELTDGWWLCWDNT